MRSDPSKMGDDEHRHCADCLVDSRIYIEERLRMHRKWFVNHCSIGVYVYDFPAGKPTSSDAGLIFQIIFVCLY